MLKVYTFTLIFIFLCTVFESERSALKLSYISNKIVFFMLAVYLILVAGLRYGIETDYWSYAKIFKSTSENHEVEGIEKGFHSLILFYKNMFSSKNFNGFIFMLAFISVGLKLFYISKLKEPFISFLQSAATAANTAVAAVLIKCGFGILAVKFSSSVVYLSRFVFLAFYVHRNYREVSFFAEADTKEICQSRNALVHQISGFVVFNSPVIVLTVLCGLKEVSVYSVYALVFSAVNNLVCSFSTGIQSFFGESLAKDSAGRTSRFFSVYETVFFLLAFWLYACTAVLILPFMKLYTVRMSDTQYIRPALAALMVLSGILTNIRNPGGQLINAAGHFKQTQFRSLLEAAVNILAGILLTLKFGTIGVVLGNICSSLYRGIDVVIYANRHILSEKSFGSLVKIICIASVFFVLVLLLKKIPFDFSSWAKWIMSAFCVSAVSFLPVFLASVYVKRNLKKERK